MSTISQYFTAGEAATKIGISIDTIRRWDKKGLIRAKRNSQNARIFSIDELNRIQSRLGKDDNENRYKILKNKNKSKHSVIELFAGAGGTALGMENAGIEHVLLNEHDKHACETLRKNKPNWNVVEWDVRQ